jgi:hypothetical protein
LYQLIQAPVVPAGEAGWRGAEVAAILRAPVAGGLDSRPISIRVMALQ